MMNFLKLPTKPKVERKDFKNILPIEPAKERVPVRGRKNILEGVRLPELETDAALSK